MYQPSLVNLLSQKQISHYKKAYSWLPLNDSTKEAFVEKLA
jgi:hypothetical protein